MCRVCNQAYDGEHYCKICKKKVHAICGRTESGDEEGYSRPVICSICDIEKNAQNEESKNHELLYTW